MKDERKTKTHLMAELTALRQQVAELEQAKTACPPVEKTLPRESGLLGQIMETSPVGITVVNRAGQIIFANPQAEQVMGLTRDKFIGLPYNASNWRITDYDGRPFPDENLPFQQVISTQQPVYNVRHAIEWPDGRRVLLSINGAPLLDMSGQVDQVVFTLADVTRQIQTEELLRIQRDLALVLSSTSSQTETLDKILQAILQIKGVDSGGIYLVDPQTQALDLACHQGLSSSFIRLVTHYEADAPQTRIVMAGDPQYNRYVGVRPVTDEVREGEGLRALAVIPVKNQGQVVAALNLASHTYDDIPVNDRQAIETIAAQIGGMIARVRAETALHDSEVRHRGLFDNASVAIFRSLPAGPLLEVNPESARLFGYDTPQQLIAAIPHAGQLFADPNRRLALIALIKQGQTTIRCENTYRRRDGTLFTGFLSLRVVPDERGQAAYLEGFITDITELKRIEEALRERNRELAILNQASRELSASLNLEQVLRTIVDEVQHLPDTLACSVWLIDPQTNELVCRQLTDPQSQLVRGWRLTPGEGLGGWVAQHKQSLNVPDVLADTRHFKGVDQKTGLRLRSILTVPLMVKNKVIGVMQAVDEKPNRFDETHQSLLESLAATAAIAIQNAQLYEQARRDAEIKLALLHEVNHRVKNNLSAIIGLLYAERRQTGVVGRTYSDIINALINRVQGLAAVHEMLSAAEWRSLLLSDLAGQIINAALQVFSPVKRVVVHVPSSLIQVTPPQANQLALVINELATNSMKYARPGSAKTVITVHIRQAEQTIIFEFRDDGPGYPVDVLQGDRQNVGLYLIRNLVRSGLQGEIAFHNDGGAVATIRFKAEE